MKRTATHTYLGYYNIDYILYIIN